ncbi:MAG: UDPglucose--hexose-phosphate uridylyltransferase [Solirubrobacteraceae bacterium]|nr:UDPglucose--hexose-phosphate uridylyltransferase [Solirubrobacteraceae bacterium]
MSVGPTSSRAGAHEIRIDPLTGLRAIVATARVTPSFAISQPDPIDPARDPFAEGHERRTAPELYARRPGGGAPDTPGWSVRVVPSEAAVLAADSPDPPPRDEPDLFAALAARGSQEIIVNAPQPVCTLADLAVEQVQAAVEVWRERMRAHDAAACLHLGVDERPEAGAAYAHTHALLYALDFVPAAVARERERFGAYAVRTMGANLLEDLVQAEVRRRERVVAIDDGRCCCARTHRSAPSSSWSHRAGVASASRTTGRPAPRSCTGGCRCCAGASARTRR